MLMSTARSIEGSSDHLATHKPLSNNDEDRAVGDERVLNQSLLSVLCSRRAFVLGLVLTFCVSVLFFFAFLVLSETLAPACSSAMSPPHARNRSVSETYCISHTGTTDVDLVWSKLLGNTTAPEATLSFAVIGDFGRDGYCCQRDVGLEMDRFASKTNSRFVINTGDSFYENGILSAEDEEVRTSWADVYNQPYLSTLEWWGVLGNHDYRGNSRALMALSRSSQPRFIIADNWWSRVVGRGHKHRPVRFIMTDTSPMIASYANSEPYMHEHDGGIDAEFPRVETQLKWLEEQLKIPNEVKIVVGHHPAFSYIDHGSEDRATLEVRLTALLSKYGALAYFAGHDHNLQFARPKASTTAYFVSGAGSRLRDEPLLAKKGDVQFYHVVHGFLACSIVGDSELRVAAVDMYGKLADYVVVIPS